MIINSHAKLKINFRNFRYCIKIVRWVSLPYIFHIFSPVNRLKDEKVVDSKIYGVKKERLSAQKRFTGGKNPPYYRWKRQSCLLGGGKW